MTSDPRRLFGPLWGARTLTRVLKLPDWVAPDHIPFEAVPRERRMSPTAGTDRVFWKTAGAAGVRATPAAAAWSLDGLRALRLFGDGAGGGWLELRLLWSSTPAWATLLVHEPWDAAMRERFAELGLALSGFLAVPLQIHPD